MSRKTYFSALAFDDESDDEEIASSVSTEKGNSNGFHGSGEADNRNQNKAIQKTHIYSVETIRSYRHDRIDSEISNLNYQIHVGSRNRNRGNNNRFDNRHGNKGFSRNQQQHSLFNRLQSSENREDVSNHTKPLNPDELVIQELMSASELLLKENEEKERKYQNNEELRKKKELDRSNQYHIVSGLDPVEIVLKACEKQQLSLSRQDVSLLLSSPAIQQEVEDELACSSDLEINRPWRYINLYGMEKGPYTHCEMRLLWEEGLLSDHLQFNYNNNGWKSLYGYYESTVNAFIEEPVNVKNQMPKTVRKLLKKGVLNTSKEEEKRVKQPEKSMKKKTTSLPVFHLQRPVVEEKEEEKTEEEMIKPPENAVSLDAILHLQTQGMQDSILQEGQPESRSHSSIPSSHKAISALNLERDAPRIANDISIFTINQTSNEASNETSNETSQTPQPKKPIISPWTKKRLDEKPVLDEVTMSYSDRVGAGLKSVEAEEVEQVNGWRKPDNDDYSSRVGIGIVLPIEEEKKTWKPVPAVEAVPLETLFKEERERQQEQRQQQRQQQSQSTNVGGKKGKKGKREWKPLDLSSLSASASSSPFSLTQPIINTNVKSIKQIQEEQMREKQEKKEKEKERQPRFVSSSSSTTGVWDSIFQSPLPSLGATSAPSRSNQAFPSTKTMVDEETFWDIAKKKSEKKETKNRTDKTTLSPKSNALTREEFDNWCREEMMALSGSDDISLLDFCISLEDSEVLSYLQDYLGQSKSVVSFAKNFNKKRQFINN